MENGWKIRVAEVEHDAVSVDVPEDVKRVEDLLEEVAQASATNHRKTIR
jgi:CMP-2-keto-3-deoxyoctulosonic acid synthetase